LTVNPQAAATPYSTSVCVAKKFRAGGFFSGYNRLFGATLLCGKPNRVEFFQGDTMAEGSSEPVGDITAVLAQIDSGQQEAVTALMDIAYDELRELAQALMRKEPAEHTLQPTALVHEAAMRLLGSGGLEQVDNRSYFFGAMCRAMRRVLVDHARSRNAARRGGDCQKRPLDATIRVIETSRGIDLVELDEALARLEMRSQRQAEVVTMRFFGGFEMREISEHLQVSLGTIENDWRIAKAWLHGELNPSA
jgi:RNA polymerase sigma factor (TIGR02999 family)